jgi:hypothetical protein
MPEPLSRRAWLQHAAYVALCGAGVCGCAQWVEPKHDVAKLPRAQMFPDSVGLEVAFVRLPASDLETNDAIWAEADEQHFSADSRRELVANGMRVGLFNSQLPIALRKLLDTNTNPLEERSEDVETSDGDTNRANRRFQCRAGRPAKICVSRTYPSLSALVVEDGELHGSQLTKALCLLRLKPYPQGDGRVRLDITPEVEHGELKQSWVGGESGSLMQRSSRDRLVLDKLKFVGTLAPGQVMLVSTLPNPKGLGAQFFTETAGGTVERTLLVIRLAQTQYDDLFAPERITTPLATPGE